jgi:hypothetical protein
MSDKAKLVWTFAGIGVKYSEEKAWEHQIEKFPEIFSGIAVNETVFWFTKDEKFYGTQGAEFCEMELSPEFKPFVSDAKAAGVEK